MPTEWLKVMLEEIARKHDDARRAQEDLAAPAGVREPPPSHVAAPAREARSPKAPPSPAS